MYVDRSPGIRRRPGIGQLQAVGCMPAMTARADPCHARRGTLGASFFE